jgi:hypothetical protein
MNFRKKQTAVDMDDLSRRMANVGPLGASDPLAYAPPRIREVSREEVYAANGPESAEVVIDKVESFGALPTKEIDEIVSAAEAEIANLKRDAQAVRDLYSRHTARIAADVKRLREGVRLSMEMMGQLREQCIALDQPAMPVARKLALKEDDTVAEKP